MAGEIGDFISFQADQLPTGSISFGRFELESLSWERRSSFCHNKYLEEVEKYSTPGSVTQKRAILEAHFKKKPILSQVSLDSHSAVDCQTSENSLNHNACYSDEFEDRDDGREPEFGWYDDSPTGSEEQKVMDCEQEEIWPTEVPVESMRCTDEKVVDLTCELANHDDILQSQNDSTSSNKDDLSLVLEQEPDNKAVIMEEFVEESTSHRISSESPAVDRKKVSTLNKKIQKAPLKVKDTVEQKTAATKQMNKLPAQQNLQNPSAERSYVSSGKMLSKSVVKLEKESTLKTKSVKQIPLGTLIPTSSESKSLKTEASVNKKEKLRQGNRSEKDAEAKKGGIISHPISRSEIDIRRLVSRRSKQAAEPSKEEPNQGGVIFSLKCNERAEKRKEYYMKVEEKLQAKEVEMNEIQARTQEETKATMKQFRRSLNFKATPMPSFYNEAVARVPEGKKKVAPQAKPQKSQSKSARRRTQTSSQERSPSLYKPSNCRNPSTQETKSSEAEKRERGSKLGGNSSGKKGEMMNRARRCGGGVVGNLAVQVAS